MPLRKESSMINGKVVNEGNNQLKKKHQYSLGQQIPASAQKSLISEITTYNAKEDQSLMSHSITEDESKINQTFNGQQQRLNTFYLTSNIRVLLGVDKQEDNNQKVINIHQNKNEVEVYEDNELFKKYQYHCTFDKDNNQFSHIQLIFAQIFDQQSQTGEFTVLTYGQKQSGKSQTLGTLFQQDQQFLIQKFFEFVFEDETQEIEVFISCYEVFLEQFNDLLDENNENFLSESDMTWLQVHNLEESLEQIRLPFLNRKQLVDEHGSSSSLSHLILNVKIKDSVSEASEFKISFIDLVGFDSGFIEKIMGNHSFNNEQLQQLRNGINGTMNESSLQNLVYEFNDNGLYQIRNLLIAIEEEDQEGIYSTLNNSLLAKVIFQKLISSENFYIIGLVKDSQEDFHENLNTLEFCSKFQQALYNCEENKESQSQQEEEFEIFSTEGQALPNEIQGYFRTEQMASLQRIQKFYKTKNYRKIQQSQIVFNQNYSQIQPYKDSKRILSNQMLNYQLLINNQHQGEELVQIQNNKILNRESDQIRVLDEYTIQSKQQPSVIYKGSNQPKSSDKSTLQASSAPVNLKEASQHTGNTQSRFIKDILFGQKPGCQLNAAPTIDNFSRIQGKSKFESSFMSSFLIQGETPYKRNELQYALSQFKQAKLQLQCQKSTKALPSPCYEESYFSSKQPKKEQEITVEDVELEKNPVASQFIISVIQESMKAVEVQMKDFNEFFMKDKAYLDKCLVCQSNNGQKSNFSSIQKDNKFFDIDKVLRDIELKDLRQQTWALIKSGPKHQRIQSQKYEGQENLNFNTHHKKKSQIGFQNYYSVNQTKNQSVHQQKQSSEAQKMRKLIPSIKKPRFQKVIVEQERKVNTIFDEPYEESRYLRFLMMTKFKVQEDQERTELRYKTIKEIESLINDWQQEIAVKNKKVEPIEARTRIAKVLSFGSFKLGAHLPQTDLDLICLFPNYIKSEEFFSDFKELLEQQKEVLHVLEIIDARVPILKVKFKELDVDLLFASIEANYLGGSQISLEKLFKDDEIFKKLNSISQSSINGFLTSINILRSVNQTKFRQTLKIIKVWAMKRCIYSNTFAYLGGVSYAIMVAKICQDYPDLELCDLVYKFFEVYSEWKWPEPVSIKIGKKKEKLNINALQILESVTSDSMPILTPNKKPTNSAYRICPKSLQTISMEILRGKEIIRSLLSNSFKHKAMTLQANYEVEEESKTPKNKEEKQVSKVKWSKLFKRLRFFKRYYHFIKIDILSTDKEAHIKWTGYVESQLRRLMQLLGDLDQVDDLRLYPRPFTRAETMDCLNYMYSECKSYFIGIKFNQGENQVVDLRSQVADFCNFIDISRVQKQVNNVRIMHYKRENLPEKLIEMF